MKSKREKFPSAVLIFFSFIKVEAASFQGGIKCVLPQMHWESIYKYVLLPHLLSILISLHSKVIQAFCECYVVTQIVTCCHSPFMCDDKIQIIRLGCVALFI